MDKAIRKMRATRGLSVKIAERLKIKKAAIYQWRRVPATRVMQIADMLEMTPEEIRPDVFKRKK